MIPQLPAGNLVMINTSGAGLDCASLKMVGLTGLADIAGSDPEPEYVSINGLGETVVTLQENNHMVVVGQDGSIVNHFSAGAVDLHNIDATDERGKLEFTESQLGRKREPDAVAWIDDSHFATANEGDYEGGSRGWTIFNKDGSVVYESGVEFEHAIIQIGHYPDKRSDSKGVEPESVTFAEFDGTPYVFVGAERASVVGVYDVTNPAAPVLTQLLSSGVGPEGYVTIPERGLLVSANEKDLIEDKGARAHVMIYELQDGAGRVLIGVVHIGHQAHPHNAALGQLHLIRLRLLGQQRPGQRAAHAHSQARPQENERTIARESAAMHAVGNFIYVRHEIHPRKSNSNRSAIGRTICLRAFPFYANLAISSFAGAFSSSKRSHCSPPMTGKSLPSSPICTSTVA